MPLLRTRGYVIAFARRQTAAHLPTFHASRTVGSVRDMPILAPGAPAKCAKGHVRGILVRLFGRADGYISSRTVTPTKAADRHSGVNFIISRSQSMTAAMRRAPHPASGIR